MSFSAIKNKARKSKIKRHFGMKLDYEVKQI